MLYKAYFVFDWRHELLQGEFLASMEMYPKPKCADA